MSIEHFLLSDPDFLLWRSELKVMFLQRLKWSLIFIILAWRGNKKILANVRIRQWWCGFFNAHHADILKIKSFQYEKYNLMMLHIIAYQGLGKYKDIWTLFYKFLMSFTEKNISTKTIGKYKIKLRIGWCCVIIDVQNR